MHMRIHQPRRDGKAVRIQHPSPFCVQTCSDFHNFIFIYQNIQHLINPAYRIQHSPIPNQYHTALLSSALKLNCFFIVTAQEILNCYLSLYIKLICISTQFMV